MSRDKEKIKIEEFNRLASQLENIQNFIRDHQLISYIDFEYYIAHKMTLFSIEPDFDFEKLSKTIGQIKKAMPAIKRLFNKPFIVLNDADDVLPVENARIINQNTLLHLANHSHHVANITNRGVKPRKLLTRLYEDDYSIYENVIFCNFIDEILLLVKKNRRTLENLLYANEIMNFNLLEKVNHMNYFMALGKLHTGYIRDFKQYLSMSKKMLHELSHVSKTIVPRLIKPIYRKNVNRNKHLALKKTNIFLMQKDYRQVYKVFKQLLSNQDKEEIVNENIDFDLVSKNYLNYVLILTIFAAGHFNFEIDPQFKMDLTMPDITFTYKGWKLDISNDGKKEVFLYFKKEKTYTIMMTNSVYDEKVLKKYKELYGVDEVVIVNPFDEDYLEREDVYISIQDIDSFRRIQQIILRGMIYADTQREACPFCGGELHQDSHLEYYECSDCMIQIKTGLCKETNKQFFYTDNTLHKKHVINKSDLEYDEHWYYEKQIEALMYFRNITKINQNSEIVCPHCHQVHEG